MTIKSIIFESMLAEATKQVKDRIAKGAELAEAVKATAADLTLEASEVSALEERALKMVQVAPEDVVEDASDEISAPTVVGNSLHFDSEDDLDSAAGMLMYKGVPWKHKEKGHQNLVEFDSPESLQEALAVLKRKFDFVEHSARRVGVVEFDNLSDYSKVMEFMKKSGMMIECKENGSLDEDAELQEKMISEIDGQPTPSHSFSAITKGSIATDMNVVEDKAARSVVVRKRWK